MKKYIALLCILLSTAAQASGSFEDQAGIILAQHFELITKLREEINSLKTAMESLKNTSLHALGENYRGGIIFYLDESRQHGLIASKIDIHTGGVQWRNGAAGNKVTNARSDGIGAGETNTRLIIAEQTIDNQSGQFAALIAANFQVKADGHTPCQTPATTEKVCYGGWYLPSAFELQLLQRNLQDNKKAHFIPDYYWSSTEASVSKAWLVNFATGEPIPSSKSNTFGQIRAIAHF